MAEANVEKLRMRTWDQGDPLEEPNRWRLVVKAQFLRYRYSWVFWILVAFSILFAIGTVMAISGEMAWSGGGIGVEALAFGYFSGAAPLIVLAILLAAAPAIAEDIRFEAFLYYFSRPLHMRDYLIGKSVFVTALLLLLAAPALILAMIAAVGTWFATGPSPPTRPQPGDPYYRYFDEADYQRDLAYWNEVEMPRFAVTHMDNFGDWFVTLISMVGGVLITCIFLAALTIFLSTYTARGWHASIAFVVSLAVLGGIGIALGDVFAPRQALSSAFGPLGWIYSVTALPLEAYYHYPDDWSWRSDDYFKTAGATVVISYMMLAISSVLLYMFSYKRLIVIGGRA